MSQSKGGVRSSPGLPVETRTPGSRARYQESLSAAVSARAAGRPVDALLLLLRAVRQHRHGVQAQVELAAVWEQIGHWREAQAAYAEAARWYSSPEVQLGQARCAQPNGDRDLAFRLGQAALSQRPDHFEARLYLAELHIEAGQMAKALELLDPLSAREPTPAHWERIDRAWRTCGALGLAREYYRRWSGELSLGTAPTLAALDDAIASGSDQQARAMLAQLVATTPADGGWEELLEAAATAVGNWPELRELARAARDAAAMGRRRAGGWGWTRRTSPSAWRVGVLVGVADAALPELWEGLAALGQEHHAELRIYLSAGDALDGASNPLKLPVASLARFSALAAARVLAEDDLDALVLAGRASGKALFALATRPAPLLVGWRTVPESLASELVDAALTLRDDDDASTAIMPREFALRLAELGSRVAGSRPARELRALWQGALAGHRAGQPEEADRLYGMILADQPEAAAIAYLRGALRRDQGAPRMALQDFHHALQVEPAYLEAGRALGQLLLNQGAADPAVEVCRKVLFAAQTDDARLQLVIGLGERQRGRLDAAHEAFASLVAREPGNAAGWFQLAMCAQAMGRDEEALDGLQKAAVLDPQATESFYNLGALHQQRGENDSARACYDQAIRLRPREAQAYKNLGEVLFASGRYSDWLGNFLRFEEQCPNTFSLAVYALEACQFMGDWGRLDYYLAGLQQQKFQPASPTELVDGLEELLYLLLFFDIEPPEFARFYRTYAEAAAKVYGAPRLPRAVRRPGRLRIGYLSGDVRDHVMGKMLHLWLCGHDRNRFEVFLYATRPGTDEWAQRIRAAADHAVSLVQLDDAAAVERIAADEIDLLIDCSTHTRGARQAILAAKPAQVQITSIASAGAVGMNSIDFKLTDRVADLPEMQEHQVEPFLVMSGCVYPCRELPAPAAGGPSRETLGIAADAVVIGAFATLLKLGRRCLKLWREVLEALPEAVIALSPVHAAQREAYIRVFRAGGIPPDRLVFIPQGRDEAENQARYGLVDIVLDPMPFGGANGTIEALTMGVPVVTLCGRRHGERVGASILTHLGVTGTIAHSGPEYVSLTRRLAREAAFRDETKAAIRRGMAHSEFTDVAAHLRHLEAAYLAALRAARPEVYGELTERGGS